MGGGGANQVLQSKVEGEVWIEGAKRLRIECEARTKGEAREKTGDGSGKGLSEPGLPINL